MEPIRSELVMQRIVGRSAAQATVESDIPLPNGRDVQRILYAQGTIGCNACRCVNGQVQAEGALTLHLLCVGKDNLPFGMQASTQYSHDIPLANANEGMQADIKPQLVDLNCTLRDQHIHLEAVAELNTLVLNAENMRVLSDVAGVSELEKLYAEEETGQWYDMGAEQCRVHESIPAPAAQQILLSSAKPQITGVSFTDTEASVQGTLYLGVLYLDEAGQYTHITQQIPLHENIRLNMDPREFKQIIVDADMDDMLITLGAEPGTFEMDAAITYKAGGIKNARMQLLSDAYAPDDALNIVRHDVEQLSVAAGANRVYTFSEAVKIPDTNKEAYRTVFASARPAVLGISDESGQLAISGIFITGVVYQTDGGETLGFEEDVPFSCTLDAPYMPDAQVEVSLLEARVSGGGRMVNVSYTVEVKALLRELVHVSIAVDAEPGEAPLRENGILVYYASVGETFWDVGKRFGMAVPAVKKWNPGVTEPFAEGQPIMLMSASGKKKR